MTGFVPKEMLTAYQRWEVAAFDEAEQAALQAAKSAAAAPASKEIPAEVEQRQQEQEQAPIVLPTAAEIERMHIEAHEQGYAAGYEEGIVKARASTAKIDSVLTSLHKAIKELDQHVAEQLLATAVEIANQMLHQSLRVKPELLLPVVREAVSTLHTHLGHPALFVHPDDAALVRTHLGDQLAHNNWRIIEDSAVTAGGCRVEVGDSQVDATLETRWRRVIESIGISQEWLSDKP